MTRRFQAVYVVGAFLSILVALLAAQNEGAKGSPVLLDGKPVVEIRWSNQARPLQERAQMVSERLEKAADSLNAPGKSTVTQLDEGIYEITVGKFPLVTVFPGDARQAGVQSDVLAGQWAKEFDRAIADYRAQRSWKKRVQRLLLTAATIVGTLFLLSLIRRATQRVSAFAVSRFTARVSTDERKVVAVLARKRMLPVIHGFFKGLRFVLSLLLIGFALQFLLFFFPRTETVAASLLESVIEMLKSFGAAFLRSLPSLLFLGVVVIVTWYALKLSNFIFRGLADGTLVIEGFRTTWAFTTQRIVSLLLIVLALLVAYPYIPGSESPAFKGISIFIGLLVSLGSTGLMANVVTGIMLTYMDAFHVGDVIQFDERYARVEKMSMLTTQLRTRWNEVLTIPNSLILSKEVANLSLADHRGIAIRCTVGVGYDVPWRQIENMMLLAAARTEGVSRSQEPYVYTLSLNQFDVTYEVNAFLEPGAVYFATRSQLNRNVLDAFNEFGVQIMTPAYEGDPEGEKVVPKSKWFSAPASEEKAASARANNFKQAG